MRFCLFKGQFNAEHHTNTHVQHHKSQENRHIKTRYKQCLYVQSPPRDFLWYSILNIVNIKIKTQVINCSKIVCSWLCYRPVPYLEHEMQSGSFFVFANLHLYPKHLVCLLPSCSCYEPYVKNNKDNKDLNVFLKLMLTKACCLYVDFRCKTHSHLA